MKPIRVERKLQNTAAVTHSIEQVANYAKSRNFDFEGNESNGSFAARGIEGNYAIQQDPDGGETLIVEITKKPMLIPAKVIETKTAERLASWDTA